MRSRNPDTESLGIESTNVLAFSRRLQPKGIIAMNSDYRTAGDDPGSMFARVALHKKQVPLARPNRLAVKMY
jgi:hypothetical protein